MSQLQQSDLTYLGAFRTPTGRHGSIAYNTGAGGTAGTAMTFNAAGNGGAGSLFIRGHDQRPAIAEISLAVPVISTTLGNLNSCTFLQDIVEPSEGAYLLCDNPTDGLAVGGILVHDGELYFTIYSYYDANNSHRLSHFRRPLNLSTTGQVHGPFELQNPGDTSQHGGFFGGWLIPIPSSHQAVVGGPALTGLMGGTVSVISRTSWGPSAFAFDPANLGVTIPCPVDPLIYYNGSHPTLGTYESTIAPGIYWSGTSLIHGGVVPSGYSSLLFFGRQGAGTFSYGGGGGTPPIDPCYVNANGPHAYPYRYQIWHYNLDSVLAAANPWEPIPDIWVFDLPFADCGHVLGDVAYDEANQLIYLAQTQPDTIRLIIHVFQIKEVDMPKTVDVATQITTVPAGDFKVKTQLLDLSDTVIDEATSQPFSVPADPPSTPNVETPTVTVS